MSFYKVGKSVAGIVSAFILATGWLYFLTKLFPESGAELKFPRDLEELKDVSVQLQQYKDDHRGLLLMLYCSAYIYKQTFAIPGSVLMNLLGGALFGTWTAFPLVCVLTAVGATCCFMLSRMFGKTILMTYFPEKLSAVEAKVDENRDNLFFFLLSARIFPFTPNFFLNMTFPIIGVPLKMFFVSVLFGLMPYNYICVSTGSILTYLNSINDIFSLSTLLGFLFIALVAVLPGVLLKRSIKVD